MTREFRDLQFVPQNAEGTVWGLANPANPWEEFLKARRETMWARKQAYDMMCEQEARARADYIWLCKFGFMITLTIAVLWYGAHVLFAH